MEQQKTSYFSFRHGNQVGGERIGWTVTAILFLLRWVVHVGLLEHFAGCAQLKTLDLRSDSRPRSSTGSSIYELCDPEKLVDISEPQFPHL